VNDLEKLREQLRRRFVAVRSSTSLAQTEPALLARLSAARQGLAAPRGRFSDARIAQGVMAFRIAGANTTYPELKYACYGVARPMDWEGRILLAEPRQLELLLATVRTQHGRPRTACCRGLQAAVASAIDQTAAPQQAGMARLRSFLQEMGATP
jgi:hypothetical protein